MKRKNIIVIVVVVVLIVLVGSLIWWWGGKEETTIPLGEQEEEEEEEEEEVYGIPLPKYPNMTKFMEEKDKETESFSVMYFIEGPDRTAEIIDFYKTKLAAEGWTLDSEMSFGEMSILEFSKGKNYKLTLTTSYADGITNLTLVYEAPTEEELKGPYDSASEVEPASDLNAAFHDDFKAVLVSVFGGAKLTSASSDKYYEEFAYIVKRKITKADAQQVRVSLDGKGYETTSTKAETDVYKYKFSKEMLGETYKEISVRIYLEEEGSRQQKVLITVYK
ncbi:hypothetical protein KJA13_01425 [Patescibacteria group bacterium]|nr:hypothetical protein [Patescibacteria group bacterium]